MNHELSKFPYKALVVNSGSSSIKFQLFDILSETKFKLIWKGNAQGIGSTPSYFTHILNDKKYDSKTSFVNHQTATDCILKTLLENKIVDNLSKIIGHRVVHGGVLFTKPTIIDDAFVKNLKKIKDLAPIHIPAHVVTIEAFLQKAQAINIAVFDTSFHQTIPELNFLYPVPLSWYQDYGVRKYGFHGISYEYLVEKIGLILQRNSKDMNGIVCHLGNGSSVNAVKSGLSFDTTMGLTPLAGVMMGTRSGDIDPSIIQYMNQKTGKNIEEITNDLNFRSGFLGISQFSNDVRTLEEMYLSGKSNKQTKLALNLYAKRVSEFIGRYYNTLGGKVDYLIFSGGIGENSSVIVEKILKNIQGLPIAKNYQMPQNNDWKNKENYFVLSSNSETKVLIVKTNEELKICETAIKLALKNQKKINK